ncbi:MAG: hypothetical protein KF814_10910 [Nitrospiraceae bacterium]|nr:hypothetical protein [Nitrospiraceae bacterium]
MCNSETDTPHAESLYTQDCLSLQPCAIQLSKMASRSQTPATAGAKLLRFGILFLLLTELGGCASAPPVTEGYPIQSAMPGKTTAQLLSCAGTPTRQSTEGEITLLRYYREAPMLEESVVGSKGSHAGIHHGCWATVVLRDDRIEAVRYRFVPNSVDASNDCEEIFANCQ